MPNSLRGEVSLDVDERTFTLVLDHEALIEAEGLYGKPLERMMVDAVNGFAGACRALLWGAMRAHHKAVTPAEAGKLFLEHKEEVGAALTAAAELSFPKAKEGGESKNPRPNGATSGHSGAKSASIPKRSSAPRRAPIN